MPTSSRDRPPITRRAVGCGLAGLATLARGVQALPFVRGGSPRFVTLDPSPVMQPLTLRDLQSRPATLRPPRNRSLLVNIWATWCAACRDELPGLAHRVDHLSHAGFDVVAISIDAKPTTAVAAYLEGLGAAGLPAFHDPNGTVLSAPQTDGTPSPFQRWSMPLTFLVDRQGRLRGYLIGRADQFDFASCDASLCR